MSRRARRAVARLARSRAPRGLSHAAGDLPRCGADLTDHRPATARTTAANGSNIRRRRAVRPPLRCSLALAQSAATLPTAGGRPGCVAPRTPPTRLPYARGKVSAPIRRSSGWRSCRVSVAARSPSWPPHRPIRALLLAHSAWQEGTAPVALGGATHARQPPM